MLFIKSLYILFIPLSIATASFAEEPATPKTPIPEDKVVTQHSITLNGTTINYSATAGNFLLKDEKGDPKASVFYISYIKDNSPEKPSRPITFCFNGGPGSSSVWLHMGAFGPKKVNLNEKGTATPPYSFITNEYSLLDLTDLVFIDPVSTGYSRPTPGEDAKQFNGVEEDAKWVAEFIRLFVTRQSRWESPKFLAGESYGGTRAAVLSKYLQEKVSMDLNGVLLISPVLDFNTIQSCTDSNDLPYLLSLPSFTAAALYHKVITDTNPPSLQKQSEEYALTTYSLALLQGDQLTPEQTQNTAEHLATLNGLSTDYIKRANLRVHYLRFLKELLRAQSKTIGRFDTRYVGIDSDACGETPEYDPSFDSLFGVFSATFNQYIRQDLHWEKDDPYKLLASVSPWNWGASSNKSLSVSDNLRSAMTQNPDLHAFVAAGYYDLAVPYFATQYTFTHLGLAPTLRPHLTLQRYNAGHMMFTDLPSLKKLKADLTTFYTETLHH